MPIGNIGRYTGPDRHNVRLNDGTVVSRSTAERMYAQSQGFGSQYERKKAYRDTGFAAAKRTPAYRKGESEALKAGYSKSDYEAATLKLKMNPADKSPNGPLANWLVTTGRRSATADYSVGETMYL